MAVTVDVAAPDGARTGTVQLDEAVFGIEPNVPVLHQVVTAQLAAARRGTQSTKTRAEVSGGGKKPFKQKGTGRARQGSERAPQFTGGGIALGPKPRSYRQRTPRKMIALALRSALSDRASEGKVKVVASWAWDEPSTRAARSALGALGLDGRILIVVEPDDETTTKSFRNLPEVQLLRVGELNAYDILVNDWIVFSRDTLPGNTLDVEGVPEATEDLVGHETDDLEGDDLEGDDETVDDETVDDETVDDETVDAEVDDAEVDDDVEAVDEDDETAAEEAGDE